MVLNPSAGLDKVPVYAFLFNVDDVTPKTGATVTFSVGRRVMRTDGSRVYPAGSVQRKVGEVLSTDQAGVNALKDLLRTRAQAAITAAHDADPDQPVWNGAEWDAAWDISLTGLVYISFPAFDDPQVVHDPDDPIQVLVEEEYPGRQEGAAYFITPSLAHLPLGVNLGDVVVPTNRPTLAPAPIYAKGLAGGVAALDGDGYVLDGAGQRVEATTDATALTSGFLPAARLGSGTVAKSKLASSVQDSLDKADAALSQTSATATYAPLASPAFTGTPTVNGLPLVLTTVDGGSPSSTDTSVIDGGTP